MKYIKTPNQFNENKKETTIFKEDGEWINDKPNETQLFLELIFLNDIKIKGIKIKKGGDEILDWKEELYEWFELWRGTKKMCFGWWDQSSAGIRWFITEEEANTIKEKIFNYNK